MRGAVLAGGLASRFEGKPKGLERVGGDRILDRVVSAVSAATGEAPLLIANAPDAGTWRPDLQTVKDRIPDQGSLGGIYTAVTAGEGPVLLVAWDMPFVPVGLLEALVEESAGFDVFLPDSGGRRGVEPLCGVYGPGCEQPIRQRLEQGDRRAIGFHDAVRAGTLSRSAVERHGDIATMFFNVNTADELRRAEELWNRRG
jgi:molybdopterin-guanine dinucleotide biosynthesis protein A